jgi:hypothetical protein
MGIKPSEARIAYLREYMREYMRPRSKAYYHANRDKILAKKKMKATGEYHCDVCDKVYSATYRLSHAKSAKHQLRAQISALTKAQPVSSKSETI